MDDENEGGAMVPIWALAYEHHDDPERHKHRRIYATSEHQSVNRRGADTHNINRIRASVGAILTINTYSGTFFMC